MYRSVWLLSYLPKFVGRYREIKNIMEVENFEVGECEYKVQTTKDNQFITTCNESGIKRFEQLLGITPHTDDTLQARISRVITRWNDTIPYTYRGLIRKLDTLCGVGNYEIVPNFNEYEMSVRVSLHMSGQVDELENMLGYMIPANIVVNAVNDIQCTVNGNTTTGSTVITEHCYTIATNEKGG